MLAKLGDSVTTDHISPAGNIKADSPAGQYLAEHGVERKDFNSYGSRRGNHEVMIRGTFANIRLKNQLLDGVEGGYTRDFTQDGGPQSFIYDASQNYQAAGTPLVIFGGKEYGSGSSRDWAAKGTSLLGVKAVITESFERIHRSNLIGMGVVPLQFPAGESWASLGLDGTEIVSIAGLEQLNEGVTPKTVHVTAAPSEFSAPARRPSSSTRSCASTPPVRPTTTATAASCSTCCARSSPADPQHSTPRRARMPYATACGPVAVCGAAARDPAGGVRGRVACSSRDRATRDPDRLGDRLRLGAGRPTSTTPTSTSTAPTAVTYRARVWESPVVESAFRRNGAHPVVERPHPRRHVAARRGPGRRRRPAGRRGSPSPGGPRTTRRGSAPITRTTVRGQSFDVGHVATDTWPRRRAQASSGGSCA